MKKELLPQGRGSTAKIENTRNIGRTHCPYTNRSNFSLLRFFSSYMPLCGAIMLFSIVLAAQSPSIEKIDPPNWWTGMTIDPVRVLLRGAELKNAVIAVPKDSGLTAGNLKWSENGHYLFFDLTLAPSAKPGKYKLTVTSPNGSVKFDFEILPRDHPTH